MTSAADGTTMESQDWKSAALKLHKARVGPLSISVRLRIPWKQVVQFLESQKRIPGDVFDLNARTYHQNET